MAFDNLKTRKTTRILLIISGIFGLLIIGAAVYFYTTLDTGTDNTETTETYCGCYYLDPEVSSTCSDTRQGFNFSLFSSSGSSSCKTECDVTSLNTSYLNSATAQKDYKICIVEQVADERCTSMSILNQDGQIVTGKVSPSDVLTITAVFDNVYSDYVFYVNNQTVEPTSVSVDQKTVQLTLNVADYSTATSLEIKASGTDSSSTSDDTINAEACSRVLSIETTGSTEVTGLSFETETDSDNVGYRFTNAIINVGNLSSSEDYKVVFSFSNDSIADLTMTDGLSVNTSTGRITIQEADLYLASNFQDSRTFSVLEDVTGSFAITAEVFQGETSLGTAQTTLTIPVPDDTDTSTNTSDNTETSDETSSFSVTKTASPSCVERIDGSNLATFTVTITNHKEASDDVKSILDKLPLGFDYVESSTKINGIAVSDTDYVDVETTGDTQEVTWTATNGWSVASGGTMTIVFQAIAGDSAITGSNINEVVVTPVYTPEDPSDLTADAAIQVAQDCTSPDTGILDFSGVKVLIGLIIIALGYFIFSSNTGLLFAEAVSKSSPYKTAKRTGIRIFKPKEFFEIKIVEKIEKKNRKN